jgi:hypothetical protein
MATMNRIRRQMTKQAGAAALAFGIALAGVSASSGLAHADGDLRCYHWMFGDGAPGEVKTIGGYTVVCDGATGIWQVREAPDEPSWSLGPSNGTRTTGPAAPRAVTNRS